MRHSHSEVSRIVRLPDRLAKASYYFPLISVCSARLAQRLRLRAELHDTRVGPKWGNSVTHCTRPVRLILRFPGVYDAPVHISEEAANARTAVPFAIIGSAVIVGILGWGTYLCPFVVSFVVSFLLVGLRGS